MKFWPTSVPRVAAFASGDGCCSLAHGVQLESATTDPPPPRISRAADDLGLSADPSKLGVPFRLLPPTPEDFAQPDMRAPGSYRLIVESDQLTAHASDESGWFYALQTLKQLTVGNRHAHGIACGDIRDTPRFPWRGSMIDSARHFQPVPWILRHLDRMAALKLNRFHWHLTDDEAWRIEIQQFPQLTNTAAWRGKGKHRYGGYYSQEDMRKVIAYARDRFITVIPEIEMPGHCNAALVAMPHLSCAGEPLELADEGWNAYTQIAGRRAFCAANEEVYSFLQAVLKELRDVFDPPYLHIGGDETPRVHWEKCPKCSALLKQINGTSSADLRVHFLNRVANFCRDQLDRPTIAWTDGVSDQLPRDQIVNAWFAGESAKAARLGFNTINSNHEWTYLDYPDSVRNGHDKPDWMIVLPLEKIYHFDPLPDGLDPTFADRVLGSEAALWTEHAPNAKALEHQLMPRLAAFAEALWSPKTGRSYDDFLHRLDPLQPTLSAAPPTPSAHRQPPDPAPAAAAHF